MFGPPSNPSISHPCTREPFPHYHVAALLSGHGRTSSDLFCRFGFHLGYPFLRPLNHALLVPLERHALLGGSGFNPAREIRQRAQGLEDAAGKKGRVGGESFNAQQERRRESLS